MLTAQQLLAAIQESAPLAVVVQLYTLLILERSGARPLRAAAMLGVATGSVYNRVKEARLDLCALRDRPLQAELEQALVALVLAVRPWPVSTAHAGAQLLIPPRDAEERLQGLTHTGLIRRMRGEVPLFRARESL